MSKRWEVRFGLFCGLILAILYGFSYFFGQTIYRMPDVVSPHIEEKKAEYVMSKNEEVRISFRFLLHGFVGPYDNIFQTADYNEGIRLELSPSGNWAIVLKDIKNGLVGVPLSSFPEIGKWHSLSIRIFQHQIWVWGDKQLIANAQLPDMSFVFDHITVGIGFDSTRSFNGEVRDFSIRVIHNYKYINIICFILFHLLLLSFLLYYRPSISAFSIRKEWVNILLVVAIWGLSALIVQRLISGKSLFIPSVFLKWELLAYFLSACILAAGRFGRKELSFLVFLGLGWAWEFSFLYPLQWRHIGQFLLLTVGVFYLLAFVLKCLPTWIALVSQWLFSGIAALAASGFGLAALYCFKVGDNGIGTDEMSAVFQTNAQEGFEFFVSFFSSWELIVAGILFFVVGGVAFLFFKAVKGISRKICLFAVIGSVGFLGLVGFIYANPLVAFMSHIRAAQQRYQQIANEYRYYQDLRRQTPPVASKQGQGELYVLLLGEASNPRHWGAYGYFRDTTPFAASLTQTSQAHFFTHAYANYVHTVPALSKSLTSANQYNKQNAYSSSSLIEQAQAAGFHTYWLSNQDKISLVDNPLTILAEGAEYTRFTNKSRFSGDESLLPLLDHVLAHMNPTENNLVIIHLIGSHALYQKRYPRSFVRTFASGEEYLGNHARDKEFVKNILNPYDTSIAYTDKVVKQIFDRVQHYAGDKKVITFMADHGEDVYNQKFHNASIFTFEMARIPLFVWASDAWIRQYPKIWKTLGAHREKYFTSDLLFDTLLGIMGINSAERNPHYDLASVSYAMTAENSLTMFTDETLQTNLYAPSSARTLAEDPQVIRRNNLAWLKKKFSKKQFLSNYTDAMGILQSVAQDGFTGIEINVSAPDLYMGHAPQRIYPISMGDYLLQTTTVGVKAIWIDMKELKAENVDAVLAKLENLNEKYHFKENALLENTLISQEMKKFSEAGWSTSFYIFPGDYPLLAGETSLSELASKPMADLTSQEQSVLQKWAEQLASYIIEQSSKNISFDASLYPFVKHYLEPILPPSISYNTWAVGGIKPLDDPNFIEPIRKNPVIQDPRVKRILLDPQTPFSITL